jgi:hypothetical protein
LVLFFEFCLALPTLLGPLAHFIIFLFQRGFALQVALDEFKAFYNHARPHQNLQGLTPTEHFAGLRPTDLRQMPVKQVTEVQALAGLMRGYWIKR